MSWRTGPVVAAVTEMERYVRETWHPLGLIVSGSIVRGTAGPRSDLDVVVIHAQPWRLREQRRFGAIPAELFVNPPWSLRRYFADEHRKGRPSTAHMVATGEVLGPAHPEVTALIQEAIDWLAKPVSPTAHQLVLQRYRAVDLIDDARDIAAIDPAATSLLLSEAVRVIIEHVFWRESRPQPRRKDVIVELAAIDAGAAALVTRWVASTGIESVEIVEEFARRTMGLDTFFEWTSEREAIEEP